MYVYIYIYVNMHTDVYIKTRVYNVFLQNQSESKIITKDCDLFINTCKYPLGTSVRDAVDMEVIMNLVFTIEL